MNKDNLSTKNLIIIGSGPAGLTAGIYASRANLNPLIMDGTQPGGQLMYTSYVENWPGEQRTLGPSLMDKLRKHAQHAGAIFLSQTAVKVDFSQSPFSIWTNKDNLLTAHAIIIATGAIAKKLNVPGEKTYWSKGVSTCAVCDGAFYKNKKVLIVGGGDTAMEDASFLSNIASEITVVHIMDKLTASAPMQRQVLNNPKIKIIYSSTVSEIIGNESNVTQAVITNQLTKEKRTYNVDGIFIAIGISPNSEIFKNQLEQDSYGYIKIANHTHTSVKGVFVAGDVADYRYRQAITAAGAGCMAALDAQRYIESLNLDQ